MANLRMAVGFFGKPWEHVECDSTVQIMSHMLFSHLIIPGSLRCEVCQDDVYQLLITLLSQTTHTCPQHPEETFRLSFCNMISRRIGIFLGLGNRPFFGRICT